MLFRSVRQALESLGPDSGEVFSRRQVHFDFIKDLKGRILVEGDILSRVALDAEFAEFIQELFELEVILAIDNLEDLMKGLGSTALRG